MSQFESNRPLISSAIANLRDRNSFRQELQKKVSTYQREATRAGSDYRQTILEKVYAAAGVETSEIERRQKFQDSAAHKFINSMLPGIAENSKRVSARHEALMKWKKPPNKSGGGGGQPAAVAEFLYTAESIIFDDYPEDLGSLTQSSSIAYGKNLVRIKVNGTLDVTPYQAYVSFVWTPPFSGMLNVAAFVAANGSRWWSSQHKCIDATVNQEADVFLTVFPQGQSANPLDCDTQNLFEPMYWDKFPGCATDTGMSLVDQVLTLQHSGGNTIPVTEGVSVVIMIVVQISTWADEAHSVVDFETGDQSINVPGVFVSLQ